VIGLVAYVDYIVLYGITKRSTVYGTLVGSVSGAAPIVAGYCAVTGRIDSGAIILFLILAIWQMPHFYAIAMYRIKDYKAAKLPVLPVKSGTRITKIHILIYIVAFIIATSLLRFYGYTGNIYLVVILIAGIVWLAKGISGFKTIKDQIWAHKMFHYSLVVLLIFSLLISVNNLI
jgi:protoheme IX farnesyltransferase